MATDILASDFQFAIHIENARRVDSAGSREINLRLSQFSRERKQCVDVDPNIYRFDSGKILPDGIDARLAAKPATARDRSEALYRIQFHLHTRRKIDNHNIVARLCNSGDLPGFKHDRLGSQKPSLAFIAGTPRA